MRHDLNVSGALYRLRPVEDQDADLIVALRSNPSLNRFLHATSCTVEDQLVWLDQYYRRNGDYYFVVERINTGEREGVIALYDTDEAKQVAEWGRWILQPKSMAAAESALLIYRIAFEVVGLDSAYCRTVADNKKVVSFHDSCEISDRRLLPNFFELSDGPHDAIEHRIYRESWPKLKTKLNHIAQLIAARLHRV